MSAALYRGGKSFELKEIEKPQAESEGVVIKISHCGICGTDLHIFHGKMDQRVDIPQVIGHEASGVIEEIGAGVTDLSIGDKVVVRPLDWCGECPTCQAGNSHICTNLKFMGIDSEGAFQKYWKVKARTVHKCPPQMSLKLGALIEPLAVACHDVRRGAVKQGDYVAIIGGGPIGLLIAMVVKELGAKVIISEISEYRLQLAKEMGFETFDPTKGDLVEHVMSVTDNTGADVVFEVTATAAGAKLVTELTKPRGKIVLVGIYSEPQPLDLFKFFWRELELLGARVYEKADFDQAVELVSANSLPLEKLISNTYGLSEIQTAFESFEGNLEAMKVLIDCSK